MDQYEVLEEIGSGSFGKVSRIRRIADGKTLVWKELYYGNMSDKEKQLLVSEVNILRELRHPHIVRYYDRIIDRDRKKIYIVMEFCSNGDLASLIKRCKRERRSLDEDTIWRIFLQVACALKECHTRSDGAVLHRDLKPGNIFLDAQNNVKLGDFGLARVLSKSSVFAHTNVGTPFYMSPEQVNEKPYNQKSDVWSLGCLIYELCSHAPPFEATNQISLAIKIRAGNFRRIPEIYSNELQRTIEKTLLVEQSLRPTVDELLSFPQLSILLKEKRLNQMQSSLRRKEEELRDRELCIEKREKELLLKEKELERRERSLLINQQPSTSADGPSTIPPVFDEFEFSSAKNENGKENIGGGDTIFRRVSSSRDFESGYGEPSFDKLSKAYNVETTSTSSKTSTLSDMPPPPSQGMHRAVSYGDVLARLNSFRF